MKFCPRCSAPQDTQSIVTNVQDSAIAELNITQIGDSSGTCESCNASNVRVMTCIDQECSTSFCELCHPECRVSGTETYRFDSGQGDGPYCLPCCGKLHQKERDMLAAKERANIAAEEEGRRQEEQENDRLLAELNRVRTGLEEKLERLEQEFKPVNKKNRIINILVLLPLFTFVFGLPVSLIAMGEADAANVELSGTAHLLSIVHLLLLPIGLGMLFASQRLGITIEHTRMEDEMIEIRGDINEINGKIRRLMSPFTRHGPLLDV